MTRDLALEVGEVTDLQADTDREGFHHVMIGGDDDRELSGFYEWHAERGEYVNEHGRTLPADAAPDSEFAYNIIYNDTE